MPIPARHFLWLVLFAVPLFGCQQREPQRDQDKPRQAQEEPPPATPGLELQAESYAKVRSSFRTKLLRKGPAPQRWPQTHLPAGVKEIVYRSGDLRLKAWVNPPAPAGKAAAVLYLHGGWAFGDDDWEQAQPLRDAGFVVMTPLLRAENGQPGFFSMFYDEIEDVLAAAEALAKIPGVDPSRVYLAGHSAGGTLTMLAAMASDRFRAAASLDGSPDRIEFVRGGWKAAVPFDQADLREFQVRSPVAYATSFQCPTRLYVSQEPSYHTSTRRTALLAKARGLDVEMVVVPGDHWTMAPPALEQAIAFFRSK